MTTRGLRAQQTTRGLRAQHLTNTAHSRKQGALRRPGRDDIPVSNGVQRRLPRGAKRSPYDLESSPEKPRAPPARKPRTRRVKDGGHAEGPNSGRSFDHGAPSSEERHGDVNGRDAIADVPGSDKRRSNGLVQSQEDVIAVHQPDTLLSRPRGRSRKSVSPLNGTKGPLQVAEGDEDFPALAPTARKRGQLMQKKRKAGQELNGPAKVARVSLRSLNCGEPQEQNSSKTAGDEENGSRGASPDRDLIKDKAQSRTFPARRRKQGSSDQSQAPEGEESRASSSEDQHSEGDCDHGHDGLLGQWPILQNIFHTLGTVGVGTKDGVEQERCEVELLPGDVAGSAAAGFQVKRRLPRLRDASSDGDHVPDAPREFANLTEWIDGLCGLDAVHAAQCPSRDTAEDIYFHVFEALAKLLRRMLLCYEATDRHEPVTASSPAVARARTSAALMSLMLHTLLQPAEGPILLRLRQVASVFQRHMHERENGQAPPAELDFRAREPRGAEGRAVVGAEERRDARFDVIRRQWHDLHAERRHAAPRFLSRSEWRHLQCPEPEPESDRNGRRFVRVEGLRPRLPGPSPAAIQRIREGEFGPWSEESLLALVDGLKRWQDDPLVLTRIIRKHCRKGGLLADRNVTEIVVAVADLKARLLQAQERDLGYVEKWVMSIPQWTKPQSLLGAENGGAVDGSVHGSDDDG